MHLKSSVIWAFVAPDWISLVCRHYRSDLLSCSVILGPLARNCGWEMRTVKRTKAFLAMMTSVMDVSSCCTGSALLYIVRYIKHVCTHVHLHIDVTTSMSLTRVAKLVFVFNIFNITLTINKSVMSLHLQHHTYNKQTCHVITIPRKHLGFQCLACLPFLWGMPSSNFQSAIKVRKWLTKDSHTNRKYNHPLHLDTCLSHQKNKILHLK